MSTFQIGTPLRIEVKGWHRKLLGAIAADSSNNSIPSSDPDSWRLFGNFLPAVRIDIRPPFPVDDISFDLAVIPNSSKWVARYKLEGRAGALVANHSGNHSFIGGALVLDDGQFRQLIEAVMSRNHAHLSAAITVNGLSEDDMPVWNTESTKRLGVTDVEFQFTY